jgi:hypothetical protein
VYIARVLILICLLPCYYRHSDVNNIIVLCAGTFFLQCFLRINWKFVFGQARQRRRENFYFDVANVISAAKAQRLHKPIKHDVVGRAGKRPSLFMRLYRDLTVDARDLELVPNTSTIYQHRWDLMIN